MAFDLRSSSLILFYIPSNGQLPMEPAHHYRKPIKRSLVSPSPKWLRTESIATYVYCTAGRIAELERQLAHEQNKVRILRDEQRENTKLIGDYEHHLGEIVKDVREYSYNNKTEKTNIAKHYNKLLQDEKDAHLAARLEKDDWHARLMRSVEMLREAYRLRCEEEVKPTMIIQSLQTEVRSLRSALGQESQKMEDEAGYGWLKDTPDGNVEL